MEEAKEKLLLYDNQKSNEEDYEENEWQTLDKELYIEILKEIDFLKEITTQLNKTLEIQLEKNLKIERSLSLLNTRLEQVNFTKDTSYLKDYIIPIMSIFGIKLLGYRPITLVIEKIVNFL